MAGEGEGRSSVLASIMPGLRDVRAPLSAGFIWMVALWFLLEPRWPESDTQGVIGSANRLLGNLSLFGQGAIVSFAAYVLGSFSVFLFSGLLRDRLRTSVDASGRLSGLSPPGRTSLQQVATDGRHRLEEALTLSGHEVGKVLADTAPIEGPGRWRARSWWWQRWRRRRPWDRGPRWQIWVDVDKHPDPPLGPTAPVPSEQADEAEIQRRVLKDLPAVATAQLLGRETEVFSAVDRSEAEVDFRIALVPALSGLALAIGVASIPDLPALAVASVMVGGLAATALMLDAARQRREANELILSLMEHGRIDPPSIERAISAALALADQAPAKVLVRQGEATRRAIRDYMGAVAQLGGSSVFRGIPFAQESAKRARDESHKLDLLMSQHEEPPRDQVAQRVLIPLDMALSVIETNYRWLTEGSADNVEFANQQLSDFQRQAAEALDEFVRRVRAAVARAAAGDAARAAIAGDPGEDGRRSTAGVPP